MPELPEVETVVRALRQRLLGRVITGVRTGTARLRRSWVEDWQRELPVNRKIVALRRRGKWIIIELTGDLALLIHLGMTGRLQVVPAVQLVEAHTHLIFLLKPGTEELRFRDPRRFGAAGLIAGRDLEKFWENNLGPEPFDLTGARLFEGLRRTRRCLKAALLDQRLVAGIGNIYADEALFDAKLNPARRGTSLTRAEAAQLRRSLVKVLRRAIEQKGSTIRDYFYDETGSPGEYQNEFRVYQRNGEPCPRCRARIRQVRLAGRATHFCPRCQLFSPR